MGNKVVSVVHIKTLLKVVRKEIHGLVLSDVIPEDRQNYRSFEKLMEERVLNSLEKNVADSQGTIMFLKLCKLIASSFEEVNLKAITRIYNIWYANFFLRCWKKWIKSSKEYSLDQNFITNNAYKCVEVNAHNLIEIVRNLRSNKQEALFLPPLFSSQPCERIFRMMRSLGTVNFTKINFSLSELFHMIGRVEIMQNIIHTSKDIVFPRISTAAPSDNPCHELPSDEEIKETIESARKAALEDAKLFGIHLNANDISNSMVEKHQGEAVSDSDNEIELEEAREKELIEEQQIHREKYGSSEQSSGKYLHFVDEDGTERIILKSTFIWNHTMSKDKLSTDRLKRVQGSSTASNAKRRKKSKGGTAENQVQNDIPNANPNEDQNLLKSEEIMIGDWIIINMRNVATSSHLNTGGLNGHLIGMVTGFRFIDEKNRSMHCKSEFVYLSKKEKKTNGKMIVLAIWYNCDENGILDQVPLNLTPEIDNYVCTIKDPIIKNTNSRNIKFMLPFDYSEIQKIV